MDIRKRFMFFHFFVIFILLTCDSHLPSEFMTTSSATTKESSGKFSSIHMTRWIQEQINGTVNICSDILGTKWKNDFKKTHNQCRTLKVWVPKKTVFTEFVNVNDNGELKGGFSIAIFCLVLQEVPFRIQPVFVPLVDEMGRSRDSYDELVQKIENKSCEAVAGDITITANRTEYVDFTVPYMSSEIYMLVPAAQKWNQSLVTLLRPFSPRLWLTIIGASLFIGIAIGILEYRVGNPEFNVPFYQKLVMIIWFPLSTFFFDEGRIQNRCSKIVLVIWLTTIFIVIQIFTACLSSWLVVNQLQPKVPKQYHVVGYQTGSCVADFANDRAQCPSTIDRLHPLSSMDDYKNVLDKGMVDAIFDELPYVELFIAKYGDNYMKVGPLAAEPGLGFAFSRGSPLQPDFSRAVVKVIGSPDMTQAKKEYLGIQTPLPAQAQPADSFPQSLDVHSFFLLFIFMGLATIMVIIYSEIYLMRTTAPIFPVISRLVKLSVQTSPANSTQVVEMSSSDQ
ncbi:putative ionotropic glutamate receptor, metazoa [Helianthus annuus]|uniref:Ionotropic glutamate receptor, metazoa n=1 Tax=Helianthus annuus TaxID=4232 RepID=A0A251UMZ7_HELAN|nr:glutamate receptor 3.1 [Helianthus annuus]KAF5804707.1 putative ionotropic glutamate receptor, metazoa [Helianthus annuus]KAJ0575726.1 putative solute-binding protein family 3/ domain of MltF [Helianthus annuus]